MNASQHFGEAQRRLSQAYDCPANNDETNPAAVLLTLQSIAHSLMSLARSVIDQEN